MDISAAFPTFAIALREGVEAALVVGLVLALLQKAQQGALKLQVYFGVFAGLGVSGLVGLGLSGLLKAAQSSNRPYAEVLLPLLKVSFSLTAIAMLTWMLVWMTHQAKTIKTDLEGALTQVLEEPQQAKWGVWTLVFVAVLREGIETALFTVAQLQQGWMPVAGAFVGLLTAAGIGWALFNLGIRINLKHFFQVMGLFLLLIVGGLVIGTCKQLDLLFGLLNAQFAWASQVCFASSVAGSARSCLLGPLLWDAHPILPDSRFPGLLLKTLLGYRDRLYVGQAIAYVAFLSSAGTLYWRSLKQSRGPAQAVSSQARPIQPRSKKAPSSMDV
jgi:high-affinity iron transporter